MEEIYKLRKEGKTWKEIQELLDVEITISALSHKLKRYCLSNNLDTNFRSNAGRKPINIKFK